MNDYNHEPLDNLTLADVYYMGEGKPYLSAESALN